jgi:uncharacterized membrane protein YdjX (TVP38/TMEM64 family)
MRLPLPSSTKLRWALAGILIAALVVASRALPFGEWFAAFGAWIAGLGPAGHVLYAAVYVAVTVLCLPAWLMTIGAGFLFGLWPGSVVVWAGATAGATLSFLIARHLARERVARAAARDVRFTALDLAIAEKGWRIVLLLRMSAVVPFVLSNYVYGLTAIRFWPYVGASAAGMVPLIVLYVGLGAAARRAGASALAAESSPLPDAWAIAVLIAGLLITAGVTVYVARLTRGILRGRPTK